MNVPAFPTMTNANGESFCENRIDPESQMPFRVIHHPGVSLREYYAGMALHGLLSKHAVKVPDDNETAKLALASLAYADALISALNDK